jgi:DNA modification methylase
MIQTSVNANNKIVANINDLKGWDKNPRDILPQDLERLKKQIMKLGQYKPLLVTPEGIVIGGNMRLKAYRDLGISDLWVSIITPKDDAELLEYALSDNDRAGFYNELELMELVVLTPIDQQLYSVDMGKPVLLQDFMDRQKDKKTQEDEPPAVDDANPPTSILGEIYQLGPHKLMCGDSTQIENVMALMGESKADMVFTDPPYNVDYVGKTKDALKIENDHKDDASFYQFLLDAFTNMSAVTKTGGAIYVCHADSEGMNFRKSFMESGFLLKQCLIWNKNSLVMGRQDYHWKHEPILYGWKEGGSHQWYGPRDQTTVWDIDRPTRSEEHPTMKPLALIERALDNSTKSEDLVLDLFGGSGSTLMASDQLGRICNTMELDPRYCDVIRKRYAKSKGKEQEWTQYTPPINQQTQAVSSQ